MTIEKDFINFYNQSENTIPHNINSILFEIKHPHLNSDNLIHIYNLYSDISFISENDENININTNILKNRNDELFEEISTLWPFPKSFHDFKNMNFSLLFDKILSNNSLYFIFTFNNIILIYGFNNCDFYDNSKKILHQFCK